MEINVKENGEKTAVMVVYEDPKKKNSARGIKIQRAILEGCKQDKVPMVLEYKYLGTWFDTCGRVTKNMSDLIKYTKILKSQFYWFLSRGNIRFNIDSWRIYVLPKILSIPEYVTTKTMERDFETTFKKSFKDWMDLPSSTSTELLYDLIGTTPNKIATFVKGLSGRGFREPLFDIRQKNRWFHADGMYDLIKKIGKWNARCKTHPDKQFNYSHLKEHVGNGMTLQQLQEAQEVA